jgi:preprotein translocase subunit SecE
VKRFDRRAAVRGECVNVLPEPSHDVKPAPAGRIERARLFLSEVRNELKRSTWPPQREVYATTVVVIVTSIVMGLYLWSIDMLLDRFMIWIFQRFGG